LDARKAVWLPPAHDGREPCYEKKTISVYSVPAKNLDRWLTANSIEGDFTVVGTTLLNRYFREYYLEHGQGGTHRSPDP
jgi:hypothetical protein